MPMSNSFVPEVPDNQIGEFGDPFDQPCEKVRCGLNPFLPLHPSQSFFLWQEMEDDHGNGFPQESLAPAEVATYLK